MNRNNKGQFISQEKLKKICPICNKAFYINPCYEKRIKYCSKECRKKGIKKHFILKCKHCGKVFELNHKQKVNRSKHHYCSRECYFNWRREHPKIINYNCEYCNRKTYIELCYFNRSKHHFCSEICARKWYSREKSPMWKGGKQRKPSGYVLISAPLHPEAYKGMVYEHRLIAEKMVGRKLLPGEEVHHKNKIRWDNRPDNLEVMDGLKHQSFHLKQRWQEIKKEKEAILSNK